MLGKFRKAKVDGWYMEMASLKFLTYHLLWGYRICHRLGSVVLIVEAPFALGVVGHEGMVALASDDAGIHEVVDEHRCALILLDLPLG